MKNLFLFLLITLISLYVSKPKDRSSVWGYAIGIPFLCIVVYALFTAIVSTPYNVGQELSMSILPALISGAVIFYLLREKVDNEYKVEFPFILVLFLGISLIGAVVQYSIEIKNKALVNILNSNLYSQNDAPLVESPKNLTVSYNGITFSYPNNWRVTEETIVPDYSYQVDCEKKGLSSSEIISIVSIKMELFPEEMLEFMKESLSEEFSHKDTKYGEIKNSYFNGINCKIMNYATRFMGEPVYGQIRAYIKDGYSILILKQSDTESKLDTEFKTMEDSFKIE